MDVEIPKIAENVDTAEVVKVLVGVGDHVETDQPILELEGDKASFEMPSPAEGDVEAIHVEVGDEVGVGEVALTLTMGDEEAAREAQDEEESAEDESQERGEEAREDEAAEVEREAQDEEESDDEPQERAQAASQKEDEPKKGKRKQKKEKKTKKGASKASGAERKEEEGETPERERDEPARKKERGSKQAAPQEKNAKKARAARDSKKNDAEGAGQALRASPAARRRARELDVDLERLAKDAGGGRITTEQIEQRASGAADAKHEENGEDFSRFGEVTTQRLNRRRRLIAERMSEAWRSIPHVTQHERFDVSELERARQRHQNGPAGDAKLTMTAFAVKACALALQDHPRMNSSLIEEGRALAVKDYVHLGVAIDTEAGLTVPVIRDAADKPLGTIAAELEELADAARAGKLKRAQLEGATFTITNLGGFGGTHFTPIINPPQVGIFGMCRAREEAGRAILPVSLSYDHRVIDGADAMRFLATVEELLREPLAMLLRA